MKIALIGYGKMGKEIEKIALERGHQISIIIDQDNLQDFEHPDFSDSDLAIEFSSPESAYENYKACFKKHIPVVSGTTGWLEHYDALCQQCIEEGQGFFYASNFSIGMNIFFEINERLAQLMSQQKQYRLALSETHHIHKKDAPSGTAVSLLEGIIKHSEQYDNWALGTSNRARTIPVEALREGEVPGTHEITYQSEQDEIFIRHEAKGRTGFALGAVLAAEFLQNKKGVFGMKDLMA